MSIQHKPKLPNVALDDAGEPCGSVGFDYPSEGSDPGREDEHRLRRETILAFLRFVSTNGNARKIGARVGLLAFLTGQSDCRTQRQLAKKLRMSTGRVAQMLNVARRDLHKLACAE